MFLTGLQRKDLAAKGSYPCSLAAATAVTRSVEGRANLQLTFQRHILLSMVAQSMSPY
jgi:hypothetical protein